MTTEQTVDKIIEAHAEHCRGEIDTRTLLSRIGDAVEEAKREARIDPDTKQMIHNYVLMALNACGVDDERKAEHHAKVASACIELELKELVDNPIDTTHEGV